jgi:SRSO17 transposase
VPGPRRHQRAQVPRDVAFQTKTELARDMVGGHAVAGVPFAWVACDEVYGRASKLRGACEDAGKGYVLAVPSSFQARLPSGRKIPVAALARLIPAATWETRSCGPGCRGHRDYD